MQNRATYWVGLEAFTKLSRRFQLGENSRLRHTIEPRVIYEFVPQSDESALVQIDDKDNLIKKSLITYSLKTELGEQGAQGGESWLKLFAAQSYHVGEPPGNANLFSDILGRVELHKPSRYLQWLPNIGIKIDSFYDTSAGEFSQINSDVQVQFGKRMYLSVGQRFARDGSRVKRGDIWNSLSFNEVLADAEEILFLNTQGAVRLPLGVTVGARVAHDFQTGETSEWDLVGLYQNPCKCFSLGMYYIQFPDREQYNLVASLTGLWGTGGLGGELMKTILSPLLGGERGVPWGFNQ